MNNQITQSEGGYKMMSDIKKIINRHISVVIGNIALKLEINIDNDAAKEYVEKNWQNSDLNLPPILRMYNLVRNYLEEKA